MAAIALVFLAWPVRAEIHVDLGVRSQVTYTDNSNIATSLPPAADVILEVVPTLSLRGTSPRLRVSGTLELLGLVYLNDTQTNRLLPLGTLSLTAEAVERWLYIDAGFSAVQDQINPFSLVPDGAPNASVQTTLVYRLSPYIQGTPRPGLRYSVRSDNSWTDVRQAVTELDGYFGHHMAQIEAAPRSIGWRLSVERLQTRPRDAERLEVTDDLARAAALIGFGETLVLGLRGGYESNNFTLDEYATGPLYGAELDWRAGERTRLQGFWEHRFFGSAWTASFTHRMPWVAWDLRSSRDLATFEQLLFSLPATGNVAGLLGEILSTRYPDPTQRAAAVDDLIRRQRLPSSLGATVNIYGRGVSIVERASASVAYLGARHSAALNIERIRTVDLATTEFALAPGLASAATNNLQQTVAYNHSFRLTPRQTVELSLRRNFIEGLDLNAGTSSRQDLARLRLIRQLALRTAGFVGLRFQRYSGTAQLIDDTERAAFLGLEHFF